MSLTVVEGVTPDVVDYVCAHLWPRGIEEMRLLGLTPEQGRHRISELARHSAVCGTMCEPSGEPVLVSGIMDFATEASTWFQATARFEQHALQITRELRRRSAQWTGAPLYIYSVCVHPETARWFKALGFTPDGWQQRLPSGAIQRRFSRCDGSVQAGAL